ncbi:MAG TPA: hypothetical protein VIL35_00970 [Vicinamibacterales bacterium]
MEVVRIRVGSALEWVVAALFLFATLGVGSLVLRELRAAAAVTSPVGPATFAAVAPAGLSERAVSVQLLLLEQGKEIKVGDTAARVAELLGREAETGAQHADVGPAGERITRFYDYSGTRFALVFETLGGEPKVTAIYIQ